MWAAVVAQESVASVPALPSTRSKHSIAFHGPTNSVYLLGGRSSASPLRDFWALSLESGTWKSLPATGDCPSNLQEHSMVSINGNLLVYGGSFSHTSDCPLWFFNVQSNKWHKWKSPGGPAGGKQFPQGKRAHSAVVYNDVLYVYGGYEDMKGSSGELWSFDSGSMQWRLIHGNTCKRILPAARHKHSAVVYDDCMWVYGGMTDLQERGDLWRFDFVSKQWSTVKCKFSPGLLHSHSAVRLHSHMLIFGGERGGVLSDELWRFHFATEVWERIETSGQKPSARAQLCAVALHVPAFLGQHAKRQRSSESPHAADSDRRMERQQAWTKKLAPGNGYEAVPQLEDPDNGVVGSSRAKLWPIVRSFTYSALSNNTSTESLATVDLEETAARSAVQPAERQIRSESVQNFAPQSKTQGLIRRSVTSVRVNPFTASVKNDSFELGALSTSDYVSEYHDSLQSVAVIPNPLYNNYLSSMPEEAEESHRTFASVLNDSVTQDLPPQRRTLNLITDLFGYQQVNDRSPPNDVTVDLVEGDWCILYFGGREANQITAFRRPMSVWMLQL